MFEKLPNFDAVLDLANHHPKEFARPRQARIDQFATKPQMNTNANLKGCNSKLMLNAKFTPGLMTAA